MVMMWVWICVNVVIVAADEYGGPRYDYTAYTECKKHPEASLYNGGVLKDETVEFHMSEIGSSSLAFVLLNLTAMTRYSFSCWLKISRGADSSLLEARLSTSDSGMKCIGTSIVKRECWTFLKGGFVLDSPSETSIIFFQVPPNPLQKRKRSVTIHASDSAGNRIAGASVSVQQITRDFPFGSAIVIKADLVPQEWFVERFNAAVFENELKWYATEPQPGRLNYTLADEMLQFVRAHQILARGHNIFWEDPKYMPAWVRNLTGDELRSAVGSRIENLLSRYKGDFVHWDVSNEMLHFDFYEQRLGANASVEFFVAAQKADPLATLFMNDFNVVEGCEDARSSTDSYVARMRELIRGGAVLAGIGIEGHFGKPDVALMRAVLDKLATLGLPIWLTEIDISRRFDRQLQAEYLEEVLREGFSHPSVDGIVLWTALHPNVTCYQMCLTDDDFQNLPAGDVVDRLLREWETRVTGGETDDHGMLSFDGFLGEYKVAVSFQNRSLETTLSLNGGDETRHLNVQL